jgi:hypothetical protein
MRKAGPHDDNPRLYCLLREASHASRPAARGGA